MQPSRSFTGNHRSFANDRNFSSDRHVPYAQEDARYRRSPPGRGSHREMPPAPSALAGRSYAIPPYNVNHGPILARVQELEDINARLIQNCTGLERELLQVHSDKNSVIRELEQRVTDLRNQAMGFEERAITAERKCAEANSALQAKVKENKKLQTAKNKSEAACKKAEDANTKATNIIKNQENTIVQLRKRNAILRDIGANTQKDKNKGNENSILLSFSQSPSNLQNKELKQRKIRQMRFQDSPTQSPQSASPQLESPRMVSSSPNESSGS